MKTLSANFIARARQTMNVSGMNVIAYKRGNRYGSGEEYNLIFGLDVLNMDIDFEDMQRLRKLCPEIIVENATQEIYFIIDCVPTSINEFTHEQISTYYKNLLKVQRELRKMGI